MSETTPHEAAIAVLRERERELDGEIQGHQRALELATARREELLDLIAVLGRKPRARRSSGKACADVARAINEGRASVDQELVNQQPDVMDVAGALPPSVFGAPSGAIVEAA